MNNNYANKLTTRDFYETYKDKHKIPFKLFRKVIISYFRIYATYLSKGYSLPFLINFGYFRIILLNRSVKSTFLSIDVSRRLRKRGKEEAIGGVAEMFVPKWSQMSSRLVSEIKHFSFELSSTIHELIEENISEIPNNMYNESIR
jgi:hypothetical protein